MPTSRTHGARSGAVRRGADGLFCLVTAVFLLVSVGSSVLVALPAGGSSGTASETGFDRFRRGVVETWSAGRPSPAPDGGDSLRVFAHLPTEQGLGSVLGIVLEREKRNGLVFGTVSIPKDAATLFGGNPPLYPLSGYVRVYTSVPLEERDYYPVISADEFRTITDSASVYPETGALALVGATAAQSGGWILYAVDAIPRGYALVSAEVAQAAGLE